MVDNILSCSRCGHAWNPRKEEPKNCPKCKSPYWNKTRKRISAESVNTLKDLIIETHNDIIRMSGGERGIRDDGGIYYSAYAVANYMETHTGCPAKLGAFVYKEFAQKHHFNDGNKRTAHVLAKIFMLFRRCHLKIEYRDALPFVLEIAKYGSNLSQEDIEKWIRDNSEIIEGKDIKTYFGKVLVELVLEENKNETKKD